MKIYVLRSDIQSVKYAKIRASSDLYFPIYGSVLVRENKNMILFIYKENTDRRISAYFTQWLGRTTVSNYTDFTILNLTFFQGLIVIELLVSEITEKKLSKLLLSKTFFFPTFSFCRQWVIAKARTYRCSERRRLIKFLQNLKRKTW